jgi:hypothetical protein
MLMDNLISQKHSRSNIAKYFDVEPEVVETDAASQTVFEIISSGYSWDEFTSVEENCNAAIDTYLNWKLLFQNPEFRAIECPF